MVKFHYLLLLFCWLQVGLRFLDVERNLFLKSVNNLNFYHKYIKPIQYYFNTFQQNLAIKKTQKYNITPFNEEKQSLFVIAVCKNS